MNDNAPVPVSVNNLTLPDPFDLDAWLADQPGRYEWLLAHTYAGVVWGRRLNGAWQLSSDRIDSSPPLTAVALLQLRLFGDTGEIFIWRAGGALLAREIVEGEADAETRDVLDETRVLWGSRGEPLDDVFTRLADGTRGLVHAVPLAMPAFDAAFWRPVRLHVRSYLTRDHDTGLARIGFSRLRALTHEEVNNNGS